MPKDIRVDGLKELEQTLLDLANTFGPKNARTSFNLPLRKAMEPVEDGIRQRTPVDEGDLLKSITAKAGLPDIRRSQKSSGVTRNIVAARSVGWRKVFFPQALAVEYGTRQRRGRHVISRSLYFAKDRVLQIFMKEFKIALSKRRGVLERKAQKGTLEIK